MSLKSKLFLLSISILLTACATLPSAFNDANIQNLTYGQVNEDVQKYAQASVKWAGVVTDLKSEESGSLVQVLYYPQDYYGRPDLELPSKGYFLIKSEKKLDPGTFFASREIIVVGVIADKASLLSASESTELPLIKATAIHPWPINYHGNYYQNCPTCYFKQLFWQ